MSEKADVLIQAMKEEKTEPQDHGVLWEKR